jgi:hypothetical protein
MKAAVKNVSDRVIPVGAARAGGVAVGQPDGARRLRTLSRIPVMNQHLVALFAAVAASAALVTGCGGGGGGGNGTSPPPPPPPPGSPRGTLVGTANVSSISKTSIDNFGSNGNKGPFKAGETASCSVSIRQIQYATVDAAGTALTASAGLLVPVGGDACQKSRPLLTFQHGTSDVDTFDGSNAGGSLPQTLAKYFVAHGYVVVIPDYLGYGASVGHYHPYVNAEADAATVIDAVRGARNWFASADGQASGATLSGQLFLSGTSEGGYVTMATHRTMERDFAGEFAVAADVPVSGPYDLATEVMNDLLYADTSGNSASGSSAFLLTAYQHVYGDLYTTPSQVFRAPWDGTVETLFPGTYGSDSQAIQDCKIPYALDTEPGKKAGNCPSTAPLLQAQFVDDYENGRAGTSGGIARTHVEANGLLQGWRTGRNIGPMTVCYGDLDTVASANATAAGTYFGIPAIDVQTTGPGFITSWMVTNSASSSSLEYHGEVEAPGCTAYARYSVFDPLVGNVP